MSMHVKERLSGAYRVLSSEKAVAVFFSSILVFGAGCSGLLQDEAGTDNAGTVESVPAGVDGVVHFDSGVVDDQATVTLMNGLLERSEENRTYEEILTETESDSDLSREEFNSATMFMKLEEFEQEEYAGVIIDTEWSWEELREAGDNEVEDVEDVEEDTYNGVTVYKSSDEMGEDAWVADFGDGTFAFGVPEAVKDVIDTREGESNSLGGDLRTAYDSAKDGYMKSAFLVPEEQVDKAGEQAGVDANLVPTPRIMPMTYYTDGNTMNIDTDMTMNSTEEAEQFYQVAGATLDPATGSPDDDQDPFTTLVEAITVEQDGETVTMSFSITPEELLDLLEQLGGMTGAGVGGTVSLGSGPSSGIAG